jgi:hypothetical protein
LHTKQIKEGRIERQEEGGKEGRKEGRKEDPENGGC